MAKEERTEDKPFEEAEDTTPQGTNQPEAEEPTTEPEPTPDDTEQPAQAVVSQQRHGLGRLWHWIITHKKLTIPLAIVLLLAILAAVPYTRYTIAGLFLKQRFSVRVLDQETKKPVSGVTVQLDGKTAKTDAKGEATLSLAVGTAKLSAEKKYYQGASQNVVVPILKQKNVVEVSIKATGRQVPVTVINTFNKKPLADAQLKVLDAETKTDKDGHATLVLPADKDKADAVVSAPGYNTTTVSVKITADQDKANTFALTPAGKIYFLSNLSGKLDVVKSDLDGSNRETVLAGTGKEDKADTVMLASRDWKYLALQSRRDGGEYAKLFLIDTTTDKVTVMDEGKARFTIYGWADHRFVYKVDRTEVKYWQPNRYALKSYDAPNRKIATLDQSLGEGNEQGGYASQEFGTVYLINNQAVYDVSWNGWSGPLSGKAHSIRGIQTNGQGKKDYKTFPNEQYGGLSSSPYAFNEIYYQTWDTKAQKSVYFEFEDNAVKSAQITSTDFNRGYPTYFISPSAERTFWVDTRDGKSTLFVGDKAGANEKQVASLEDYASFGWFTDDYLLASKRSSELYIIPVGGLPDDTKPFKITDYFRPEYAIRGYGGGY